MKPRGVKPRRSRATSGTHMITPRLPVALYNHMLDYIKQNHPEHSVNTYLISLIAKDTNYAELETPSSTEISSSSDCSRQDGTIPIDAPINDSSIST